MTLEQPLIAGLLPRWLSRRLWPQGLAGPAWLVALLVRLPQLLEERRQRAEREALQKQDTLAERELLVGLHGE